MKTVTQDYDSIEQENLQFKQDQSDLAKELVEVKQQLKQKSEEKADLKRKSSFLEDQNSLLKSKNTLLENKIKELKLSSAEKEAKVLELSKELLKIQVPVLETPSPKQPAAKKTSEQYALTEKDSPQKKLEFSLSELGFEENLTDTKKVTTPKIRLTSTLTDSFRTCQTERSNYRLEDTLQPSRSDETYRDFFLLTYQSVKINSEDISPFFKLSSQGMYEEIVKKEIPFHKVRC